MSYKSYHNPFEIATDANFPLEERAKMMCHFIYRRGYGNQAQEWQFWKDYCQLFFQKYPQVLQVEWSQYQDYDDSRLFFGLHSFKINQSITTDIYFALSSLYNFDFRWDFEIEYIDAWAEINETEKHYLASMREPIQAFFLLVQALQKQYGNYYWLYVFGQRSKIIITKEGIQIDTEQIDFYNGSSYSKEFYLENHKGQKEGYGSAAQELGYVAKVLKNIIRQYPEIESFEWSQYQDYDDSNYCFQPFSFIINQKYQLSLSGTEFFYNKYNPKEEKENYEIWSYKAEKDVWEFEQSEFFKNETQKLRKGIDALLSCLRNWYVTEGEYYFIYVFGRRAKVILTQQGLEISNENLNYWNGEGYDKVFKTYFDWYE